MHNDGFSALRFYARWHFFIPNFGLTKPSHMPCFWVSIDRLLILKMLQHVFPILGNFTPCPASNANKAKVSLRGVASMIQSGNYNNITSLKYQPGLHERLKILRFPTTCVGQLFWSTNT